MELQPSIDLKVALSLLTHRVAEGNNKAQAQKDSKSKPHSKCAYQLLVALEHLEGKQQEVVAIHSHG